MKIKNCYLCSGKDFFKRPGKVRDNSKLKVLECKKCSLVFLSSFSHIKNMHYENSGMHKHKNYSIQKWLKETNEDDNRRYKFIENKIKNKNILDFGCGVGGFLSIAKKSAKNALGLEIEKSLQKSFKKRKLDVFQNLEDIEKKSIKFDLITSFHVFEHLYDPKSILIKLSKFLDKNGEIIFEVPNSDDALLTLYENNFFQNFTYWSQHLFLFNSKTIKLLIKKSGLKLNWVKHIQRYPLSNHLYWLSKKKPGGHKYWNFLDNLKISKEYERQLGLIGKTDTLIASVRK